LFMHCRQCDIRKCTEEKGYTGCHQCDEFPCRYIDEFPMTVGKKVILRAIPYWREAINARRVWTWTDKEYGTRINTDEHSRGSFSNPFKYCQSVSQVFQLIISLM
jgi:hypothetical protein